MTSYLVMSKLVYVICYQCSRASNSFWIGFYYWNHKKDPKWSLLAVWLWKHSKWCSTATQFNTRTKGQFSHLWQPVPNDVSSDYEQSTKTTIPHSVDDAHIWRHSIKKCGYILGVLRPQQFPEDVIETANSQNWYNHIIGFDTSFHSMT